MKIYTKGGDKGRTSLIGGERVSKCDSRVEAYGTVDELSAFAALLADNLMDDERFEDCTECLRRIGSHLMTVSALLAVGEGGEDKVAHLNATAVEQLEQWIDAMQEALPAIDKFTIMGGDKRASLCHVCRTVCRRAERAALRADAEYGVSEQARVYLNRLSDYFYALARTIVMRADVKEILWRP